MGSRQAGRIVLQVLAIVALSWFAGAATASPAGDFQRGWQAYQAGQYNEALDDWAPLAEQGDADAQLNVGLMYDAGQGVAADPVRAFDWYRQAAEGGHAAAQYNLALMYVSGRGTAQDDVRARFWLEQAAAQGLPDARVLLSQYSGKSPADTVHALVHEHSAFTDALSGASTGTAWPVAPNYAVTSNHVVEGVETVLLYNASGLPLHASVVLRDSANDIALLRSTTPGSLPPPLPMSRAPGRLGSDVFTLGFPRVDVLGRSPKLAAGIISSINGYHDDPATYQTSVPIQPGNSGGPLLNMAGEVVGIVASMLGTVSETAGTVTMPNISYAIKVERLLPLLRSLPAPAPAAETPAGAPAPLADLAERIQSSILLVVAAE